MFQFRILPKNGLNFIGHSKILLIFIYIHEKCVAFENEILYIQLIFVSFQSANIAFEVCIVDDASLCSEAEILPLFRLKLNTLLLVGDEKLQTSTTQNEVSIFFVFEFCRVFIGIDSLKRTRFFSRVKFNNQQFTWKKSIKFGFLLQCCRENGYSRSLFSRIIESYKQYDPKRRYYYKLDQQCRQHQSICSWPNKYFYKNTMKTAQNVRVRVCPLEPYTVFQVNTIEDIEVDFVEKLLDCCVNRIKPYKFGIICGHPASKDQIETMLK